MQNHEDIVQDLFLIIKDNFVKNIIIPELVVGSGVYGLEILHNLVDLGCVIVDDQGSIKKVDINMNVMVNTEIGITNSLTVTDVNASLYESAILFATLIRQLTYTEQITL